MPLLSFCDEDDAADLAGALVKFEEVDFSAEVLRFGGESLLLGALIPASETAGSKLKKLTIQARTSWFTEKDFKALEEARERFAVNLVEVPDPDPEDYDYDHSGPDDYDSDDYDYDHQDSDPYDEYDYDDFGRLI